MRMRISKISMKRGFNPREKINRADIQALAASMKVVGQLQPIVIREGDNELVDGTHRLRAAESLHWKEIDCRPVKVSDLEARIVGLASNNFAKRLNVLEIGRSIHLILEEVGRRGNKGKVKLKLAQKLGLSVSELESCLATYRNLHPHARELSSYAVRKGLLNVEQLRQIRQLSPTKQIAILKQIVDTPDSAEADGVLSSFMKVEKATDSEDSSSHKGNQALAEAQSAQATNWPAERPLNELIQTGALRLFRDVSYTASGLCPECHKEISMSPSKLDFDTKGVWKQDLSRILRNDLDSLEQDSGKASHA
jgi:ParB/RepB/Spo0J family partition protein